MNADKYKKNKFRKLVPTSNSESDKLQHLATIDHPRESTKPHLTISQEVKRNASKVGVEGVSERYKEKHFVFERRLKTISAINEREEEPIKHSNSSVSQYKIEREKPQPNETNQLQSLIKIIEEFKNKTEQICKAECIQQLRATSTQNHEEEDSDAKMDDLTERTKATGIRLILIYTSRLFLALKRQILLQIAQFQPEKGPSYEALMQEIQSKPIRQVEEGVSRPERANGRRNLINVSKFFGST